MVDDRSKWVHNFVTKTSLSYLNARSSAILVSQSVTQQLSRYPSAATLLFKILDQDTQWIMIRRFFLYT